MPRSVDPAFEPDRPGEEPRTRARPLAPPPPRSGGPAARGRAKIRSALSWRQISRATHRGPRGGYRPTSHAGAHVVKSGEGRRRPRRGLPAETRSSTLRTPRDRVRDSSRGAAQSIPAGRRGAAERVRRRQSRTRNVPAVKRVQILGTIDRCHLAGTRRTIRSLPHDVPLGSARHPAGSSAASPAPPSHELRARPGRPLHRSVLRE